MSDGPYKSLNMRPGWKVLSKRAYIPAFSPAEVSEALPLPLVQDWNGEILPSLVTGIRELLAPSEQWDLLGNEVSEGLEALKRLAAARGSFGALLVDCAHDAIAGGRVGEEALQEATINALTERALRGARSVDEHFKREGSSTRAASVRRNIEQAITRPLMESVARRVLKIGGENGPATPVKRQGLDDGVSVR